MLNRKELTAFLSNKMETSVSYFWALCHGIKLHCTFEVVLPERGGIISHMFLLNK